MSVCDALYRCIAFRDAVQLAAGLDRPAAARDELVPRKPEAGDPWQAGASESKSARSRRSLASRSERSRASPKPGDPGRSRERANPRQPEASERGQARNERSGPRWRSQAALKSIRPGQTRTGRPGVRQLRAAEGPAARRLNRHHAANYRPSCRCQAGCNYRAPWRRAGRAATDEEGRPVRRPSSSSWPALTRYASAGTRTGISRSWPTSAASTSFSS